MASGWYYGFWDYWKLYHKVTFDGINKIIYINAGETAIDVQRDLYSAWKEWLQQEENTKYIQAFTTVGGEPTLGNERLDATFFFINGWRLKPYPGQYSLTLTGNVFDVDGDPYQIPADKLPGIDNNILINTNTSVIVRQVRETIEVPKLDGTEIISASLFGSQSAALDEIYNVSSSVQEILGQVYNISGSVVEIRNILQQPLTASLTPEYTLQLQNIENLAESQSIELSNLTQTNATQSQQLTSLINTNAQQSTQLTDLINTNASQSALIAALEGKITEIWELHGLDVTKPLTVTQLARTFGSVNQNIVTTGTGSLQQTIITRV